MAKILCKDCGKVGQKDDFVEYERHIMMSNDKESILICEDCARKRVENRKKGLLGGLFGR